MVRCSGVKKQDCANTQGCAWTVGKGCGKTKEPERPKSPVKATTKPKPATTKRKPIRKDRKNTKGKDLQLMNLPNDVLDVIAKKIRNPANLAQLGAVSKHWHQQIGKVNSFDQIGKALFNAIKDIFAHRELSRVILRLSIGGLVIECTVHYPKGKMTINASTETDAKRSRLYTTSTPVEITTTSIKVLNNYLVKGTELQNKVVFSRYVSSDHVRRYGANISQLPESFQAESFMDIFSLVKDISDAIGQKPRLEVLNYYTGDTRKVLSVIAEKNKVELRKVVRGLREVTFRITPLEWAIYRDTDEFLDRMTSFAMNANGNIVRVSGQPIGDDMFIVKETTNDSFL